MGLKQIGEEEKEEYEEDLSIICSNE